MVLKKLYLDPPKFFEPVEFVNGVNFIYAYRDPAIKQDIPGTLNNLGKSSFLDLIDFCLGSDFNSIRSPRLYIAYNEDLLLGVTVYLEFEISGALIVVSRSFDKPALIGIRKEGSRTEFQKLEDARSSLFKIIFNRQGYQGVSDPAWFRSLMSFYIKILKHRKTEYPDPFFYLDFKNITVLLQFHLFLLNINNSLFVQLFNINQSLKKCGVYEKENLNRVMEIYGFKKFSQAGNRLNQMNTELAELKDKLNTFHLAQSQQINAEKANLLSKQINQLTLQNYLDQQKIDSFKESIKNNYSIRISDIEKLYNETSEFLGANLSKTLKDAVEFKKQLHDSRKSFVEKEINSLNEIINNRKSQIEQLDVSRAEIYAILSTANAVKNYSDSRNLYDSKMKEANILEGQINSVQYYSKEIYSLKEKLNNISSRIFTFCESISSQEKEIALLIDSIYSAIYPSIKIDHLFSFSTDKNIESVLKMSILETNKKHGKGLNKVRSLIYDLSILFYSIIQGYNAPRFVIHDGIFDGVDKAKALETIEFLDKKVKEGYKFQYIVTLNDEGILQDYGKRGELLHERILNDAIVRLTPSKPLFKKDF